MVETVIAAMVLKARAEGASAGLNTGLVAGMLQAHYDLEVKGKSWEELFAYVVESITPEAAEAAMSVIMAPEDPSMALGVENASDLRGFPLVTSDVSVELFKKALQRKKQPA